MLWHVVVLRFVVCCGVLCCAVLCCAVLCCAALRCAVLCCYVAICCVLQLNPDHARQHVQKGRHFVEAKWGALVSVVLCVL